MGIFSRRQKQPALPSDIVRMMERFGRFEFNPQANADYAADIGQLMADLYPFASAYQTPPDDRGSNAFLMMNTARLLASFDLCLYTPFYKN